MYTDFAMVYDRFMSNVPYDEWTDYVKSILRRYKVDGEILELGCGTGRVSRLLSKDYKVTGIDISPEMLDRAIQNDCENIEYVCMDMRELEFDKKFSACVCICDGMNYMESLEDFRKTLLAVRGVLKDGAPIIFDFKTEYFFREVLGNETFAISEDEEASLIWDNCYDEEKRINEYYLEFFVQVEDDLYRKYTEVQYQYTYGIDEILECLKSCGFIDIVTEGCEADSERAYFIARKG